jgi:hypothetical protein
VRTHPNRISTLIHSQLSPNRSDFQKVINCENRRSNITSKPHISKLAADPFINILPYLVLLWDEFPSFPQLPGDCDTSRLSPRIGVRTFEVRPGESETLHDNKKDHRSRSALRQRRATLDKMNASFPIVRIHPPNDIKSFLVDLLCFSLKRPFLCGIMDEAGFSAQNEPI